MEALACKPVGKSKLYIFAYPTVKKLKWFMQERGVTFIITIQGDHERADEIKQSCAELGLKNYHLNLAGALKPFLEGVMKDQTKFKGFVT